MNTKQDPVHIEICHLQGVQKEWRRRDQFLFVLSGQLELAWEGGVCQLQREDVCFLPAGGFSRLDSEQCCLLSVQFDLAEHLHDHGRQPHFDLNSAGATASQRFDPIRRLLAHLANVDAAGEGRYRRQSLLYAIIDCLTEHFQAPPPQQAKSEGDRVHISRVLEWLDEHYAESVSLTQLAKSQNLSPSWLSACFQKELGCSFLTYYNKLRLSRAFADLCSTANSIESIALSNGFKSERAFANQFKEVYGTLPSVFRREHPGRAADISVSPEDLGCLAKYLTMQDNNPALLSPPLCRSAGRRDRTLGSAEPASEPQLA